MALYSGDWYWNEDEQRYDVAFEGEPFTSWSGGETFLASRAVVERIDADQARFAAENPGLDWDRIRFDADGNATLVAASEPGAEYPVERSGDEYVVGFGWTWSRVDEPAREVVR
jgi:hypothetical protein